MSQLSEYKPNPQPAVTPSREGFPTTVKTEQEAIEELAESNPGVVYLGYASGAMAVSFDAEAREDGITDVRITRTEHPDAESDMPSIQYHVLVAGVFENASGTPEPFHTHKTFYHAMPALNWVEESVRDFDLCETCVVYGGMDASLKKFHS